MKRVILSVMMIAVTQVALWAAPFTQGNLVVYRVGDGTSLLTNAGNYAFLDELTTNGTLVQSIALPQNEFIDGNGNVNYPIQNSAAATSEGMMTLSTDGRYLVFTGYATNDNWKTSNGGLPLPTSTVVPRVVGRAGALGDVDTTTGLSPLGNIISGSGGNPRAVASTDGSNFWIAVSTKGVCYTTLGSNDVRQLVGNTNKRAVGVYDQRADFAYPPGHQQLYVVNAAGPLSIGTNVATVSSVETQLVGVTSSHPPLISPYEFVLLPLQAGSSNVDTAYLADEGSALAGSVSKWCYSSITSNWSNFGSVSASIFALPCGVRGITASISVSGSQTNVNLYVAAGCGGGLGTLTGTVLPGGWLYAITDSSGFGGTLTGSLPAPIAATSNLFAGTPLVEWRGVAFAPAETLRVTSISKSGSDVPLKWDAMAGRSYIVQSTPGDANGNYNSSSFTDLSPTNFTLGFGLTQNSFTDSAGATNKPSRYYRVKLVPEP